CRTGRQRLLRRLGLDRIAPRGGGFLERPRCGDGCAILGLGVVKADSPEVETAPDALCAGVRLGECHSLAELMAAWGRVCACAMALRLLRRRKKSRQYMTTAITLAMPAARNRSDAKQAPAPRPTATNMIPSMTAPVEQPRRTRS